MAAASLYERVGWVHVEDMHSLVLGFLPRAFSQGEANCRAPGPSSSGPLGRRRSRPCGSLVAPRGYPGPPKCEEQWFPVELGTLRPILSRTALQPCKGRSCWTPPGYPDNHDAICSDAVELLWLQGPKDRSKVGS